MKLRTYRALQASIRAWKKRANGKLTAAYVFNCPLCQLYHPEYVKPRFDFNKGDFSYTCENHKDKDLEPVCPVKKAKYSTLCRQTPYIKYTMYRAQGHFSGALEAAEEEVAFLQSLLPHNKKK